jgi:FHA domain
MWYIREVPASPSTDPPVSYWCGGIEGLGRTIGRKNVDVRLKASSVSRTHATIHVQSSSFHRASRGTVPTITDSSAYGTFLKYPRGHHANWGTLNDGHHDRLDKDTPVELSEGALLAFGAPSSWWCVGWYPILVFPHAIPAADTVHLELVVKVAGLAVVDPTEPWSNDVTHLLTPTCRATSTTFLRALVGGKQIVSPAWANAVLAMVDACKGAPHPPSEEAAAAATAIPPEEKFRPSFADEDVAAFEPEVLSAVFTQEKSRASLFASVTFVFPDDGSRVHWTNVLEACGARTVVNPSAARASEKLVYVRPVGTSRTSAVLSRAEPSSGDGPSCSEHDIICAILSANGDRVLSASRRAPIPAAVSSVLPDAATPVPSDSDAETADNDHADVDSVNAVRIMRRKRPRVCRSIESADDDPESKAEFVRSETQCVEEAAAVSAKIAETEQSSQVAANTENDEADKHVPNPQNFENNRSFFKLSGNSEIVRGQKVDVVSAANDVRLFKRKALPHSSPIVLEKARYQEIREPGRLTASAALSRQGTVKKRNRLAQANDELDTANLHDEDYDNAVISDDDDDDDAPAEKLPARTRRRGRAARAFVDDERR